MELLINVFSFLKTNMSNILSAIGVICTFISICQASKAKRFANKAKTIVERDAIFKAVDSIKFIIMENVELFKFINPNLSVGHNSKKLIVDKAVKVKKDFIELTSTIPATCSDFSMFNNISLQTINTIYTEIISSSMIYDNQIQQLDSYFLSLQEYLKSEQNKFMNSVINLREKKHGKKVNI